MKLSEQCKFKNKIYKSYVYTSNISWTVDHFSGNLTDTDVEFRSIRQQNIPDFIFSGREIL